ncbi:ABC transporter ATP-binding protein [Bacillus sp. LL01]|uniref:ABC transporter ATP-binding protein n=1 Tax=Bacillus sp. LL01 TaxID=1665556 RepID=UPI001F522FB7|nr:ABC transporter ATP-binding protein [Bacillus sp. LL01]
MTKKQPVAQIRNVKKKIGKKEIIHGISLDVYPGEVFGFLGPNGAGKTTMIRMLVGLMKKSEGEILIQGFDIEKEFEEAIRHIGGIIENPEMYKYLTGYDNLVHYARMHPDKISEERVKEVVTLVGLEERINEKVQGYSLGMRQRLGVAQALLHSPSLLILDEPTNGLDPAGIREIRQYIRHIAHTEGLAVFVSSHLLSEMQLMCDRIGIIKEGSLVSVETVDDFVNSKSNAVFRFEVDRAEEVYQYMRVFIKEYDFKLINDKLEVTCERVEIPLLIETIVKAGFLIYSVSNHETTLEEKFLEMTEGN